MEATIALRYKGPAVESGLMDVYEASNNMIAFSEFAVLAAKIEFGSSVDARAEVAGFSRGSFVTDIVVNIIGATATVFSSVTSKQFLDLLEQAFRVWKHLKGQQPTKIEQNGPMVSITNNNGQIIQVSTQTMNLVFSDKGSESASRFVRDALSKEGMDGVEITSANRVITEVGQDESRYFVAVAPSETITDTILKMGLTIEAPVFKDGNKWRFSDGQQSFHANIEDRDFLSRVDAGERFGKGDVLYAEVRLSQQRSGMKLTADRVVVRVLEHKQASAQSGLFN